MQMSGPIDDKEIVQEIPKSSKSKTPKVLGNLRGS